jgi:hypothetical protein
MPYEVTIARALPAIDRSTYIIECCVGGDVVAGRLLPAIRDRYGDVEWNQEDWGWFLWFREGDVRLAIDIFTDDADLGVFRIHLTSQRKRWLVFSDPADAPALEELRTLVWAELAAWANGAINIARLDRADALPAPRPFSRRAGRRRGRAARRATRGSWSPRR